MKYDDLPPLPPKLKETLDRFAAAAGLPSTDEVAARRQVRDVMKDRRNQPVETPAQTAPRPARVTNDLHKTAPMQRPWWDKDR